MADIDSQEVNDPDYSLYKRYKRDLPVDLNLIDSALFIKNKNWCQSREITISNQNITILGGKYADKTSGKTVELSVPGEFDENVLYAIICQMLKYKEQHSLKEIPQTFICTYSDIINNLKIGRQRQDLIRESLRKLRYTIYHIHNQFLTRDDGSVISEEEVLKGNSKGKIKKISIDTGISILQEFSEMKIEDVDINTLGHSVDINEDTIKSIISGAHGGTQYVLKIALNDKLYKNLISKVYMLHSLEFLLELPGVERAIHMFAHLNAGREIYMGKNFPISNNLTINVGIIDLAERIPLATYDKQISTTYKRIVDALSFLMSSGYIKSFCVDKQRPIRNSKFTIEFHAEQSRANDEFKAYDVRIKKSAIDHTPKTLTDKTVVVNNPPIDQHLSQKHKKFNEIIASIQNSLGLINSGNMVALKKLFEENIDVDVTYNHKVVSNSKGLIIIEAIFNWLAAYPNIKTVNGLLSKGIRHSPQPLYVDAYNEIAQRLYGECVLHEEQENKLKQDQVQLAAEEEKRRLAKVNFSAKLSEWKSAYYKADSIVQDRFKQAAHEKYNRITQKNLTISIDVDDLVIMLFAIEEHGSEIVSKIYRAAYTAGDLIMLGINR